MIENQHLILYGLFVVIFSVNNFYKLLSFFNPAIYVLKKVKSIRHVHERSLYYKKGLKNLERKRKEMFEWDTNDPTLPYFSSATAVSSLAGYFIHRITLEHLASVRAKYNTTWQRRIMSFFYQSHLIMTLVVLS